MSAAFKDMLTGCTGPEDPQFKAAALLADAWGPALNRSYRLGYDTGYAAGFYEAEADMAKAWANAARRIRTVLDQPTREELARLRGEHQHDGQLCTTVHSSDEVAW